MFSRLTFNCFYLRSNVFLMGFCADVHVWLLNNEFLILSKQTNKYKLQQLYPCRTKLDFKLELISLFTNYSRVIVCCFVLLVSQSNFSFLSLYTCIDSFFQQQQGAMLKTQRPTVWLYEFALEANHLLLRFHQTARSQIALSIGVCSFSFIPFFLFLSLHQEDIFFPPPLSLWVVLIKSQVHAGVHARWVSCLLGHLEGGERKQQAVNQAWEQSGGGKKWRRIRNEC